MLIFEIVPAALVIAGGLLRSWPRIYAVEGILYRIVVFILLIWVVMFFAVSKGPPVLLMEKDHWLFIGG